MPHNEELLDYLKNDISQLKIQNELSRRQSNRWATLALSLIGVLLVSIMAFATSTFLMVQEHSRQIATIFAAEWEVSTTTERVKIEQNATIESDNGANATMDANKINIGK